MMLSQFQQGMVRLLKAGVPPVPSLPRILKIRFDRSKLRTVDSLVEFIHTRSSYIAQTSLHGYLKTRMGTSFRAWFEDEAFSDSIRIASVRVFLSCLADLTVFSVATAARQTVVDDAVLEALAGHAFRRAAVAGLAGQPERDDLDATFDAFDRRARLEDWRIAAEGRKAFTGSEADLVRLAPVIDEYRELDREIVTNSIRFRWRDVREQIRRRMDGDGLFKDWKDRVGRGATGC
ncbi:MAG: hypothetical protein J4G15_14640 [Alphaproteobacteria bacterium]|nr:hypothetical protein [Alphaproteobacteria bacterium]